VIDRDKGLLPPIVSTTITPLAPLPRPQVTTSGALSASALRSTPISGGIADDDTACKHGFTPECTFCWNERRRLNNQCTVDTAEPYLPCSTRGGAMNTTQGENMDLSTITTDDLLAEVARRIEGQTKPESENWPVVNGYEIKPGANLRYADLRGADLGRADLRGADLGRADLRGVDLRDAYLGRACLRRADLRDANLVGANLSGAYLVGANLSGAYLRDANLRGAYLGGADLRDANLGYANLMGARVSDTTIIDLPAGWKIEDGLITALEGER